MPCDSQESSVRVAFQSPALTDGTSALGQPVAFEEMVLAQGPSAALEKRTSSSAMVPRAMLPFRTASTGECAANTGSASWTTLELQGAWQRADATNAAFRALVCHQDMAMKALLQRLPMAEGICTGI